ncbi:MAG: hypothetical protein JO353_13310, partial [Phycisphaerae bacterium]|nr:hypothetical protein [Phycisphaerae bacterium]
PGDRLFIFTDGIEVCFTGEKVLDTAVWHEELRQRAAMKTADILAEFDQQLESASGSLYAKDDLTIIVAEMPV